MSFEINIPSKYTPLEVSPTFKGDLTLVFDNEVMPILAKQLIDDMKMDDLARLFDAKQIEELKEAIQDRE